LNFNGKDLGPDPFERILVYLIEISR